MAEYDSYEYSAQDINYQDIYSQNVQDADNNVINAQLSSCFRTPRGMVCRDFRTGIECMHPRFGRSFCRRFR